MILIDQREKNSLIVSELLERKHEIKLQHLPIADYIIGDIAIERKTLSDFISSMLSKRLMKQLENMKQFKKQLLILESNEKISESNFHPNALRGMLLAIALEFNIPTIFTQDYKETADYLILLDKKQNKKPTETSLIAKRIPRSLQEQQQIILEGFPGIGPKTSKVLLKEFKTIKKIVNAKEKDLEKHINKDKIQNLKKIIEARYID
jgi:ERCC4-type nuclease